MVDEEEVVIVTDRKLGLRPAEEREKAMSSHASLLYSHLSNVFDVFRELQQDLLRCEDEFRRLHESFPDPTPEQRAEGQFWLRVSIRAFFSLVEGVAYTMRQSALVLKEAGHLPLSVGELVLLREKTYHWEKGKVEERDGHAKTLQGVQMAFTIFPRAFGISSFDLETSGHRYDAFQKALKIRHSVTHPKAIADLYLTPDQLKKVALAFAWFKAQMEALRDECRTRLEASEK